MKIVAISDTHNRHRELKIPKCDVLIFAGDASFVGDENEMNDFFDWFRVQPAQYLVFVPGNHEVGFYHKGDWHVHLYRTSDLILYPPPYIHVLVDNSVTINGMKIYGSPWTEVSPKWGFQFPWYERDCKGKPEYRLTQRHTWAKIPQDVDILVTHAPPKGILDEVPRRRGLSDFYGDKTDLENCGDRILLEEIRKRPSIKYHFFGHIHESHGKKKSKGVRFYNVAVCDRSYEANNPITIVKVK